MEIDSEVTPRQRGRRKSATQLTFHSNGVETEVRPNIDVVLSLKDAVYKTVLNGYFRKLGVKKNNEGNDAEKEVAREVLHLFKYRKKGETVRFFKPESRYSSKSYSEVDETAALEKITADIYRRMESAKRWMNPEDTTGDDGSSLESSLPQPRDPPGTSNQYGIPSFDYETGKMLTSSGGTAGSASARPPPYDPTQQTSTGRLPAKSAKKKKRKLKKVPQSLPFLSNTNAIVADIIFEEELRAKKATQDHIMEPEEVINFFQGLYAHGWGEWEKVSNMVANTDSSQNIMSYAMELAKKFPEVKEFFDSRQVQNMQEKRGVNVKRYGDKGAKASRGAAKFGVTSHAHDDPTIMAASVMGAMKHSSAMTKPMKPNILICIGDHIIDTKAEPSLIHPSNGRKRPSNTLPDYFDPSVKPSVPTNSKHILIPGNKVYARWMNKEDPGSYGTWYPGFVHASKIAPIQDEYNFTGVPRIVYHVKFDDGAESLDLDVEDIMIQDQYRVWLADLEQYYSLPVTNDMRCKRLKKNTRVFAKWIDPTDPQLHGSWMPGKVHSSRAWEDETNKWRHGYHICFDNGDQDEDLLDGDVIEEGMYQALLRDKIERGRKKSRLSGFDLITEASKISSPVKMETDDIKSSAHGMPASGSVKKKTYSEKSDRPSNDTPGTLEAELRCNEELESRPLSPTNVARLSNTPSPDIHYGIYMKAKPWKVDYRQQRKTEKVLFASSNGTLQEDVLDGTDASKAPKESHSGKTNGPALEAKPDRMKHVVGNVDKKYPIFSPITTMAANESCTSDPHQAADHDQAASARQVSAGHTEEIKMETNDETKPLKLDNVTGIQFEEKATEENTTTGRLGSAIISTIATIQSGDADKSSSLSAGQELTNAAMPDAASQSAVAQELTNLSNTATNALMGLG